MAHRNWINIAALNQWQPSEQSEGEFTDVDLSAYVDPLHAQGLRIVTIKMAVLSDGSPYGLPVDTTTNNPEVGLQVATGNQTALLSPADGRVLYHQYSNYFHDVDADTHWQIFEITPTDKFPDGYDCVIDQLTVASISSADFSGTLRIYYSITGYKKKFSPSELSSLLVAQAVP